MPVLDNPVPEGEHEADPLEDVTEAGQVEGDAEPEEEQSDDDDELEDDLFIAKHPITDHKEYVDDDEPPLDNVKDLKLEAKEDGSENEDIDGEEILHDKLLLQAINDEVEIFDDDLAVADFEEWFEEIPSDEIVFPVDEVLLIFSSNKGF